jgi:hypothetical protein
MQKNIGKKIIEFLREKSDKDFPKSGIIAGQSVAEAYFRIMNIPIKTRIKDIDIFHSSKVVFNKFEEFKASKNRVGIIVHGEQQLICEDGSFGLEIRSGVDKTCIVKTVEIGMLNLILIDHLKGIHPENLAKYVVDGFDINSVQIGVDLKNNKLYKTNNFDEFVKTKQLMLVNYCSPITSLFRLLEKINSYEGAFLNKEYELNLVAIKSMLFNSAKYYRGKGMTKERYDGFSEKTKSFISKHFIQSENEIKCWYPENYKTDKNGRGIDQYFTLTSFDVNEEKINSDFINNTKNIKSFYENNGLGFLPYDHFNYYDRNLLVKLMRVGFVEKFLERLKSNNFSLANNRIYNDIHNEKINDINKCKSHNSFSLLLMSKGYKLNGIADFIRLIEKQNLTHLIGAIETGSLSSDIIKLPLLEIEKIYQKQLKNLNKDYKYNFKIDLSKKHDIHIEQITNNVSLTKLGSDMGHCVGGYWTRVNSGKCFVFDIKKDIKNNERWTVAFNRIKNMKGDIQVKLEQVKGKYNERAPKEIKKLCNDIGKDLTGIINKGDAFVKLEELQLEELK